MSPCEVLTSTLWEPALGLTNKVHSIRVSVNTGVGVLLQVAPPKELLISVVGRLVPWIVIT